jgi:hypothetical protein
VAVAVAVAEAGVAEVAGAADAGVAAEVAAGAALDHRAGAVEAGCLPAEAAEVAVAAARGSLGARGFATGTGRPIERRRRSSRRERMCNGPARARSISTVSRMPSGGGPASAVPVTWRHHAPARASEAGKTFGCREGSSTGRRRLSSW